MKPLESLWYGYHSCFGVCGNNSVVECDLAKVEVAGSNPVSRSISSPRVRALAFFGTAGQIVIPARSASNGAVAKW